MAVGSTPTGKVGNKLLVAILWLMIWELSSRLVSLPFLLPGPISTLKKMMELWGYSSFWLSLSGSLFRVMVGFLLAAVTGTALAVLCARFRAADVLLSPIKTIVRSTPISSFIILVLLWLSVSAAPVFIGFLAVMPMIWQDVQQGIGQTPVELLEMGRAYRFSRQKTIANIYIPSVLPYLYTACANGIGFAWKACIAAEVIARPLNSVGKNLQDAKVYLLTDELFAWTVTVIMLSMALEAGMKRLIRLRGASSGGDRK